MLSTGAPVTIAVAGGGAVGAAALARIASGEMLGSSTSVKLQIFNNEFTEGSYPLLNGATVASSPEAAFRGASYALLLGGGDFASLGKAVGASAPSALVGVAGNTNALVASSASGMADSQFTAITRLAEMAAGSQLSEKTGGAVANVIAWGDGGVADLSHATVDGKWALEVADNALPELSLGSIAADGQADAIVSHMRDWALGSDGRWVSMGVPAIGDFGTGTGIFYSVPVVCSAGAYRRVGGVSISPESASAMEKSRVALVSEKVAAGL